MYIEFSAIIIAILSLLSSMYVIGRDKKYKRLDNFIDVRKRILDLQEKQIYLNTDSITKAYFENPDSQESLKRKNEIESIDHAIEREFEFACYLILNKQIDLLPFWNLFSKWIIGRHDIWKKVREDKVVNYKYTWKLIQLCKKKNLIHKD